MLPKINWHRILKVSSLDLVHSYRLIITVYLDTVFDVKRLIGREFSDPNVQQDIKHFPFKVIEKNSKPIIQINTGKEQKLFAPEEISAMILGKMREIAVNLYLLLYHQSISFFLTGSLSRKESYSCCCHCSSLFQWCTTSSNKRCWNHFWFKCNAYY